MEEFGRESFLMIRQSDNKIRSFYNVCQHRGARLTFNDLGSTETFKCPYHGWQWRIDGELIEAQDAEDFPEGNPCGKLKLEEVKTETFAGFIWINMDPECIGLKETRRLFTQIFLLNLANLLQIFQHQPLLQHLQKFLHLLHLLQTQQLQVQFQGF